jgi:hypothetical protein
MFKILHFEVWLVMHIWQKLTDIASEFVKNMKVFMYKNLLSQLVKKVKIQSNDIY